MKEHANDHGVTLFMPHVADVAIRKTADAARFLTIVSKTRKMVQITPEMLLTLNYKLKNPLDDGIIDYLQSKDLLAVLWAGDPRKSTSDVLSKFVADISDLMPVPKDEDEVQDESEERSSAELMERVLDPLIVYLDGEDENVKIGSHSENLSFVLSELAVKFEDQSLNSTEIEESKIVTDEKGSDFELTDVNRRRTTVDGRPKLVIPPVWTPANQEGNFMLMYTFFTNVSFLSYYFILKKLKIVYFSKVL